MASKREFNPWGFLPLDLFQLQNITRKLWLPAVLELPPLISLLQPILLGSLPPPNSYPSSCLSFWAPYPPSPTHIPPAAYPSGLPTPLLTHIPPAAYPSVLPTPPPHSYPSCCLSFGAPYPPPNHIPPAAYPSELPNPCPLPPMNALEESITEILQRP